MKFNISESEKKSILEMYGLVKEQSTSAPAAPAPAASTQSPTTTKGGVGDINVREINGMDVKAPFIKDGNALSTFLAWSDSPNYNDKFMIWYGKAKNIIPTMANQWYQDFNLKLKQYNEGKGEYPYYVKQIVDSIGEGLNMAAREGYDPNMSDAKFRELFKKTAPSLDDAKWKLFDVFKLIYNEQKAKLG